MRRGHQQHRPHRSRERRRQAAASHAGVGVVVVAIVALLTAIEIDSAVATALLALTFALNAAITGKTSETEMEKPTLFAATSVELLKTAVLMPMTWPEVLSSGPPEFPDEIAVSV